MSAGHGFGRGGQHPGQHGFNVLDADHDGKISKDEVLKVFNAVDANGDGFVTKEEIAASVKKAIEARRAKLGDRKEPGKTDAKKPAAAGPMGFRGPFGPLGGPPSADRFLERFDKNKDGKLTKDEVPDFLWERLSKSDADKDGAIGKSELEAHMKQMFQRPAGKEPAKPDAAKPKDEAKPKEEPKKGEPKKDTTSVSLDAAEAEFPASALTAP